MWRRGQGAYTGGASEAEAKGRLPLVLLPANHTYTSFLHTLSKMTTYIPSLTLPSAIFENAALSVLFPIVAGTAVGFSTQRKEWKTNTIYSSQPLTSR
jgi:hypothetical protein